MTMTVDDDDDYDDGYDILNLTSQKKDAII
jgi:hypothetical protein